MSRHTTSVTYVGYRPAPRNNFLTFKVEYAEGLTGAYHPYLIDVPYPAHLRFSARELDEILAIIETTVLQYYFVPEIKRALPGKLNDWFRQQGIINRS